MKLIKKEKHKMIGLKFKKINSCKGNYLGFDEIEIIDKQMSRIYKNNICPFHNNNIFDYYEYEYFALADGELFRLSEDDLDCLMMFYKKA